MAAKKRTTTEGLEKRALAAHKRAHAQGLSRLHNPLGAHLERAEEHTGMPKRTTNHLTPKQATFVREYLKDLNATQAAIRAHYSPKTAFVVGYENLKRPYIQAAIQAAMDARAKRTEITIDRVLLELARLAFVDVRQFYDDSGKFKPLHALDADTAAAL